MNAQIIPLPDQGVGHYWWTASKTLPGHYTVRRGTKVIGWWGFATRDIPFCSEVMQRICAALDAQEREVSS